MSVTTKLKTRSICDSMAVILKNRYDVITLPHIVRFQWNLVCRCRMNRVCGVPYTQGCLRRVQTPDSPPTISCCMMNNNGTATGYLLTFSTTLVWQHVLLFGSAYSNSTRPKVGVKRHMICRPHRPTWKEGVSWPLDSVASRLLPSLLLSFFISPIMYIVHCKSKIAHKPFCNIYT